MTAKAEGYCLYGKVSLESLYMTWESSPNFNLGQRAEIMSTVDFSPCFLKVCRYKDNFKLVFHLLPFMPIKGYAMALGYVLSFMNEFKS